MVAVIPRAMLKPLHCIRHYQISINLISTPGFAFMNYADTEFHEHSYRILLSSPAAEPGVSSYHPA
jgi:hypothetical protein